MPEPEQLFSSGFFSFSNALIEAQSAVTFDRAFVQVLSADGGNFLTPTVCTLTQVTGSMYDANGVVTSGMLHIKPNDIIVVDDTCVYGTETTLYTVSGGITLYLAPSSTVGYTVEFDPLPSDPQPMNLKIGYWKKTWFVPAVTSIDIANL